MACCWGLTAASGTLGGEISILGSSDCWSFISEMTCGGITKRGCLLAQPSVPSPHLLHCLVFCLQVPEIAPHCSCSRRSMKRCWRWHWQLTEWSLVVPSSHRRLHNAATSNTPAGRR